MNAKGKYFPLYLELKVRLKDEENALEENMQEVLQVSSPNT